MPDQIKVAVITQAGGAHLSAYFPALAAAPEVGEVVLGDPSGESVVAARKALGDRLKTVSADPLKLLADERPGMALVSMEAASAPPLIDAALEANCHVFAEKPSCVNPDDFAKLVRKADSKHRYLMLALANRLNPPVLEARRLIRQGTIGKIFGMEMHIVADQTRLTRPAYRDQWFAQKARAGGGHLIWLGIHWLDLGMYLTGSVVEQVAGFTANVGGQPLDVEDSAAVALKFANGTLGTLTSGYYLDQGYHSHIKIWGATGWLHLEPRKAVPLEWYSNGPNAQPQQYTGPTEPSGYTPFVRAAVRACAGLAEPPITSAESLLAVQTVFAAYTAAEKGQTQRL